jgi:hypothetical protein
MSDLMPEEESHCQRPCEPPGCEECTDYWVRMEEEGFWKDGHWTEKGWREILRHA